MTPRPCLLTCAVGMVWALLTPALAAPRITSGEGKRPGSMEPAVAPASLEDRQAALKDILGRLDLKSFSDARLSSAGGLILDATDAFAAAGASAQAAGITAVCSEWEQSLRASAGIGEANPFLLVVRPAEGTLWRCEEKGGRPVQDWADSHLDLGEAQRSGRLFFSFGGQMSVGGLVDQTGLNTRLGTTLFQDRYDLAVTYGHETVDTTPKFVTNSYGLAARALFPIDARMGWNIGVQGTRSIASSGGPKETTDTASGLAGLSFYLPGGSVDVTVHAGNHSSYGVLVGYTIYLTN